MHKENNIVSKKEKKRESEISDMRCMHFQKVKDQDNSSNSSLLIKHRANDSVADMLQPFKTATKILVAKKKSFSAGLICRNNEEGHT